MTVRWKRMASLCASTGTDTNDGARQSQDTAGERREESVRKSTKDSVVNSIGRKDQGDKTQVLRLRR